MGVHPGGWPVALDFGIYWFGPNGQFKKAQPSQQVRAMDPTSWFEHENRADQFYDPSRNTVIYFHGWSGADSWFPQTCERLSGTCGPEQCPNGGGQKLADPWLQAGWNVGFFYWDQFANEPCMRNAEQKIWFDRNGNGLRWPSYVIGNSTIKWNHYKSENAQNVADLCASSVKEAIGDFYGGSTVRFVGFSIGAQLAVNCATKLHATHQVAAPQRLTLLEPFFTKKDPVFLGIKMSCGKFDFDEGVGGFTGEAMANYVKALWQKRRVVTEIYISKVESDKESQQVMNERAQVILEENAVLVKQNPQWCYALGGDENCKHRALMSIYFLSFADVPPPLEGSPETRGMCKVPASSCTDPQLRALVEQRAAEVEAGGIATKLMWEQRGGEASWSFDDDTFALMGAFPQVQDITLDPGIEQQVANSHVLAQREWGLKRRWDLGPAAGLSSKQLHLGLGVLGSLVMIPGFAMLGFSVGRFVMGGWSRPRNSRSSFEELQDEEREAATGGAEEGCAGGSLPISACIRSVGFTTEDEPEEVEIEDSQTQQPTHCL